MKKRVLLLYGGRSGEHEVALRSAASILMNLDPARFDVVPVAIDKQGRWLQQSSQLLSGSAPSPALPVSATQSPVMLPANPQLNSSPALTSGAPFDVIFPVLHGTFGEDGTVQGLFELANVPYVGAGVLGSAIGMDKEVAKRLAKEAGIPIVPFVSFPAAHWTSLKYQERLQARICDELGFPCFVKPANSGSSVGIHKVKTAGGLDAAIRDAIQYDTKILVEKGINAREIEISVLENREEGGEPRTSTVGEINPTHEFYSYEAKYLDENGATFHIPAQLKSKEAQEAQELARKIFAALACEGMARVDLFLDRDSGNFYFNEINTIPGFTSISMYPKLWEASGLSFQDLVSELIELAIARHARRNRLSRSFVAPK